jgi:hypothetical protein
MVSKVEIFVSRWQSVYSVEIDEDKALTRTTRSKEEANRFVDDTIRVAPEMEVLCPLPA